MATVHRFEDLDAYQKTRELIRAVADASSKREFASDYRFRSQIRSASSSIASNIAEGFERDGTREFLQFLAIAKASAGEVRSQLYDARDFHYITEAEFDHLMDLTEQTSRLIGGLMRYLKRTNISGTRYKRPPEKT